MDDSLMARLYPALLEMHLTGQFAVLDESLNPRPPQALLNLAGEAGLDHGMLVLDVGCGPGHHAALLAGRHGCRVLGIDLAPGNLRQAMSQERLDKTTYFGQATVEALPVADGVVDLVVCFDILLHVQDLDRGLAECRRVMRPGGHMIILATLAGEHLDQEEAAAFFTPLGIVPGNLVRERLEAAFDRAGLAIHKTEIIGSERLEYLEEEGGYYGRELMRLARLHRDPAHYQQALGTERYELALGLYTLSIYLLIGKLSDVLYWLKK
jgi:ubiquinone/menaquinone biosynthesis C-methylase UbiE